jgi:hypothetical protein
MKNGVLWDVTPCGPCKYRRFGGFGASFLRVKGICELGPLAVTGNRLLVTANVVPSSPILVTLMEALRSSETSVLTRATRGNIPEDAILQNIYRSKPWKPLQSNGNESAAVDTNLL